MKNRIKKAMSLLLVFAIIAGIAPANLAKAAATDNMTFYLVDKTSKEVVKFGSATGAINLYSVCDELESKGCKVTDAYREEACVTVVKQDGELYNPNGDEDIYFLVDRPNKELDYIAYRNGEQVASGHYKSQQGFYFDYDIRNFEEKLAESGLEFEGWYASYDEASDTFSNPITENIISVRDEDVTIYAKIKNMETLTLTAVLIKEDGTLLNTETRFVDKGRPYNISGGVSASGYDLTGIYRSYANGVFSRPLEGESVIFTENTTLYYVLREEAVAPGDAPTQGPVPTIASTIPPAATETVKPTEVPSTTNAPQSGTEPTAPAVPTKTPDAANTPQPGSAPTQAPAPTDDPQTETVPPAQTQEPTPTPNAGLTPAMHDTTVHMGQTTARISATIGKEYGLKAKIDEIATVNNIVVLGIYTDEAFTNELTAESVIISDYDDIYVKTQKVTYTCIQVSNGKESVFTTDNDPTMTLDGLKAFLEGTIKGNNIKLSAWKDKEFTQAIDSADYFKQNAENINVFVKIENDTIEIDKETYTVVFDINTPPGVTSSGNQTVSVTEGTALKLPEVSCPGYIFEGWYDGDEKAESPYTVTKDVTLTGKWTKDESIKGPAEYKIICDNTVETYTISQGGEIDITPYVEAKKKEGYLVLGIYLDEDYEYQITDLTKVDVSTISNIYIRVQYLRYHYNDSVTDMAYMTNKTVMENKALYEATFMNAASYKFEYWMDKDGTIPFDSINATTNARPYIDIYVNTLIADPNAPQLYTITFEPQWPVEKATKYSPSAVSGINGTTIALEDASCYGYVFLGWYLDSKYITKAPNPYTLNGKSVRLYAKWEKEDPNKKWTVTFNANTGECLTPSKQVTNGQPIGELPTPTKIGYYFIGWYTDKLEGEQVTENTIITADTTIYAHYSNKEYAISYRLDNGTNNKANPNKYIQGQVITLKDPTRKGYLFLGWYTDAKCTIRVTTITQSTKGNLTLYAKWKKVKPPKAKIASLKNVKKKKIKVTVKKANGATGYEIKFSTSKKYNKGTVGLVTTTINKYTIKRLRKTKYYLKVRSYVIDSRGKKIYGKWSKSKTIKVKK